MNRTVRLAVAAAAAAVLLAACGGEPAETVAAVDPGPSPSAPRHTPTATTKKADPVWYREVCSTLGQMSAAAARSDQTAFNDGFDFLMATRAPVEVSIAATESCPEHRALAQEYRAAGGIRTPTPSASQPLSPYQGSPYTPPGYGPAEPLPDPGRSVYETFKEEIELPITIRQYGTRAESGPVCRRLPFALQTEGISQVHIQAQTVEIISTSPGIDSSELSARLFLGEVDVSRVSLYPDAPEVTGTVTVEVTCRMTGWKS